MKDLQEFNPTEAHLLSLVEKTKVIQASDLTDAAQLAVVRQNRIELKRARVEIEKAGKAYREEAVAYQKAVIAKEKELIAIIEPEEERLKQIEAHAAYNAELVKRREQIPDRLEKLEDCGLQELIPKFEADEDYLTSFSDAEFDNFINIEIRQKNDREAAHLKEERESIERERRELEQKEIDAREQAEREKQEALEKRTLQRENEIYALGFHFKQGVYEYGSGRVEVPRTYVISTEDDAWEASMITIKEQVEEAKAAIAKEQMEAYEQAQREAVERERANKRAEQEEREEIARREEEVRVMKEKEQQAALEARRKYQNFLKNNDYIDDGSFKIENDGVTVTLYKKVATMKI